MGYSSQKCRKTEVIPPERCPSVKCCLLFGRNYPCLGKRRCCQSGREPPHSSISVLHRITDLPNSAEFTGAVALAVSSVLFAQAGVEAGHEAISGDRVGYMGDALSDHGWAYVAGVKIAAEIPLEDTLSFRGADREQRDEALNWLASTGARVLVTRDAPNTAMPMGWRKSGRYGLIRSAAAGSGTSKIALQNVDKRKSGG